MPKRKCCFNDTLKEKFPFIKESVIGSADGSKVECMMCRAVFSISHGGKADIDDHVKTKKHKAAASARSSSETLTNFFRKKKLGDKEKELAAQEATFVYHTVKHNQSFQSMDCTSILLQKFSDKKFTCKQTKCQVIAVKVLAPQAIDEMKEDLKHTKFCCLGIDSSNHIAVKVVPIVVRYFMPEKGICTEILEVSSLPGETSDLLANHILKVVEKYGIADKVIGISADNTNTNFGGLKRRGKNNVFAKLQERLRRKVIGIGCAAHIVHNAVQTSVDVLPIDVQAILGKVFQYFHHFTVRVEELKTFCDFVEIEYKNVLGYSKTRWLSLEPALNRFIEMYDGLKSYFLSQNKCPNVLLQFFNNRVSFVFLLFLKSQLKLFSHSILEIESEETTAFEVKSQIDHLVMKLSMRKEEMFLTSEVKAELKQLEEEDLITSDSFMNTVSNFYATAIDYIKEWSLEQFSICMKMEWVSLRTSLPWEKISQCAEEIKVMFPGIDLQEESLFDDYCHVKLYATENKVMEWNRANCKVADRWKEMFAHFKKEHIHYSDMESLVSFCLTLPGSNASVERVFSQMNSLWTSERNSLHLDTVGAMLTIKVHYKNVSCSAFFDMISSNHKLLDKIHSSDKYSAAKSNESEDDEATPSTSQPL